jgi:ABC-2 type transport system permease protein
MTSVPAPTRSATSVLPAADRHVPARAVMMPFDRVWRAYLAEVKAELLRASRLPAFVIPFMVLPIAFYLFFGLVIAAQSPTPPPPFYLYSGFAVFGMMGPGLFGFGVGFAIEREHGLYTLRRALPAPPAAQMVAKMVMSMLFCTLVITTFLIAGLAMGKVQASVPQFLAFAFVCVLGGVPFSAIGLFIGTIVSGRVAPGVLNLVYLPMTYLSNIMIPLPAKLAVISVASPAFHLNMLALHALGRPSPMPVVLHVAVLVAFTVVFGAAAAWRLSRE